MEIAKREDVRRTDNAAWIALLWSCGISQRKIAKEMGRKASELSVVIESFIRRFLPDVPKDPGSGLVDVQGEARRSLALDAVVAYKAFVESGGEEERLQSYTEHRNAFTVELMKSMPHPVYPQEPRLRPADTLSEHIQRLLSVRGKV